MLVLLNVTMEPSNLIKNKGTTICDRRTIKFDIGTAQCDNEIIKFEKTNKGTTKCNKITIKCDIGTIQCENETVKCEKQIEESPNVTKELSNMMLELYNVRI